MPIVYTTYKLRPDVTKRGQTEELVKAITADWAPEKNPPGSHYVEPTLLHGVIILDKDAGDRGLKWLSEIRLAYREFLDFTPTEFMALPKELAPFHESLNVRQWGPSVRSVRRREDK
jgi:hypothetical protein